MKNKPSKIFAGIIGIIILTCLLLFIGLIIVRGAVIKQFGHPTSGLTLFQKVIYPVELFFNQDMLTEPNKKNTEDAPFSIDQGESVALICLRLEQVGLVNDAELLQIYLVYSGLDRQLKSGEFVLSPAMSPIVIAAELMDISLKEAVVTVLPGWRIEEVAANVSRSGLSISEEAFIAAAYTPNADQLALLSGYEVQSLEGFLSPGEYVFPIEANNYEVMDRLLVSFSQNLTGEIVDGFTRQGLTLTEGIKLASIIEKEAVIDDEKPLIASVFLNRLAQGMRLETDPTIQYALGFQTDVQTWWKSPLDVTDLSVDSPYNTYQVFGLPPSPICNPGITSLMAAAFPAETPYYYFRAACDGSGRHSFAITFEEHLNNGCEE